MKHFLTRFRVLLFLLCTYGAGITANAQFTNGNFAAPGTAGCNGGTGWTTNPSPNYAQYVTFANPNPWIDLTPCWASGNGTWVEQTINTTPGVLYFIRFDLGTWASWGFDAGVDITINGNPLGGRVAHSDPAPAGAPGWKRMSSCLFRATGPTTVVRFTGNGQYIANPSNPVGTPGVIGFDNVELKRLNDYLSIIDDDIYCNIHCLDVYDVLPQDTLAHSLSNFKWYVQGVLEGTGPTFCRKYPRNVTKNIMVTFDVTDACGTHADTLYHTITAPYNCPCDISGRVSIMGSQYNCNSFHFDMNMAAGYVATNTQWTVNGLPVGGSLTALDIWNYPPGTYTICATVTGHLDGEPNNTCTTTVCTTITISYIYSSAPDVYLWTCGTTPASFSPGCGFPYTSYKITGPGFSYTGTFPTAPVNLPLGTYTLECYDPSTCSALQTTVHVYESPYVAHSCDVYLNDCSQLENLDPSGPIMTQLFNNCPDCANTLMNMTSMGQWEHVSYDAVTGELVVRRQYVAINNCQACIVTYHISNYVVPMTYVHAYGQPCMPIFNNDLLPCLRNKPLQFYLLGHANNAITVDPNAGIMLCCENENGWQNPTYILFDPNDPCCMMRIMYVCVEFKPGRDEDATNITSQAAAETVKLSIQPNPASSVFRIASGKGTRYEQVEVVDISGRVLLVKKDVNEETLFDISSFSAGHYLVKVKTETGIVVLKLEHLKQ